MASTDSDEQQCLLDQREQEGVIDSIHSEYKRHRKQMDFFFIFICALGFIATFIPFMQNEASAFFILIAFQFVVLLVFHFLRHKYSLFYSLIPNICTIGAYCLMQPFFPGQFFWSLQFIWFLTFFLEFGFRSYKRTIFSSLSKLESLKYNFFSG